MANNEEIKDIEELKEEETQELTLDDLVAAKIEKDKEKDEPIKVYIKGLKRTVIFTKPSTKRVKKMSFKAMSQKPQDLNDAQVSLIYDCCPMIKNNYKKLMEVYEVKGQPYDLIDEIFKPDEQNKIVLKLNGSTEEDIKKAQEGIKNS
jgi:hypothetical protein